MEGGWDPTLEQRLKRLMLFRVVMITTLLLIAIWVESRSETLIEVNPLYLLIAATYGLTILYVLAWRYLRPRVAQVYVQVVLDIIVITGLVYVTGGTGSRMGFMLLYPISVLSGSVLLYRRGGLYLAGVATLCYAAMIWAVRRGMVPAQGMSDIPWMAPRQLLYLVFVTGVACVTVAMIGSYFVESLRRAGERLQEAAGEVADLRELNQVILDSIHSGLATSDVAGRLLYINAFGEGILGKPRAELRGRRLREVFGSVHLEDSVLEATAAHGHLGRLEIVYRLPNGRELDLGVSLTPLATAEPGRGGFLLVFQDLTEIKRLEREVVVKEKLAAVGEMAAHLAHEIRNPLGSISGSAQVLMTEPNMSPEQEHLLTIITRESRRLSETLNQFLYQTRPTPTTRGPVDVGRLIEEAVTLLRNGPEVGPDHGVAFESEPGPHVCVADPDQIAQVFWNLTRNALEAMPEGGLLRIRLGVRGDDLIVSFRDEGRGMAREEQRRIFEPFRSGTPMGSGLGLAIVYRIIREHRGDITVRSVPGRGTEIEVRLPLVAVVAPS